MRFIKIVSCLALLAGLAACDNTSSSSDSTPSNGDFDRKAMLQNIGQNVILPNYQAFNEEAQDLKAASKTFRNEVTIENLQAAREAFKAAYKAWQRVKPYNFGPAQRMALRKNMNTFPVDTAALEKRINNKNFKWGPYDNDTKGLPALDYLLYRQESKEAVVDQFNSGNGSNARKQYLKAVVSDITSKAKKVHQKWQPSNGDYLSNFTNSTGNSKGSSLGLMVNQLNFDFETIKDEKLGIPAGKKSMGKTFPKKVEAYYSSMSLPLMKANLQSIENTFLGRHNNTNGLGLDDHLDAVNAKRKNEKLSKVIKDQFDKIDQHINSIPRPLSQAVRNDNQKLDKGFRAIKRQVVFLKTDMPSALGVRITYQDNDGD